MAREERKFKATEEDKRRMRRLAEDLKEFESNTVVEGQALRDLVEWTNRRRAARGIPPLDAHGIDDIPEMGFHERARALGMVRPGGTTRRRGH